MVLDDMNQAQWRPISARRIVYATTLLIAYLAGTLLFATNTPFPTEFDELAHLSYIKAMAEAPALFARHDRLKLLDADRLSSWSNERNYLSHPTAYYLMMSPLIGDEIDQSDITVLRLTNIAIGMTAILAVFVALMVRVKSDAAFVAGASLMALCPMASVVNASIGNDALTLPAGALALLGSLRLIGKGPGPVTAVLAGLALAVAGLAKLNAGLLIGVFLLTVHIVALRNQPWREARWIGHVLIVALFGLAGIAPYLVNLLRFGSVIHVDVGFHVAQIPGPEPWLLPQYAMWFVQALGDTWSAYEPADFFEFGQLILLLGLSVLACRSVVPPALRWTACGALAAVVIVLPIHLGFAYDLHVETLHLSAAQSRYYLALVPVLTFAAAVGLDSISRVGLQQVMASLTVVISIYASLIPAAVRTFFNWRS